MLTWLFIFSLAIFLGVSHTLFYQLGYKDGHIKGRRDCHESFKSGYNHAYAEMESHG